MKPMALSSQTYFTVVLWIWMNQAIIESHAAWFRWGMRSNVYYFPESDEKKYENAQIECQSRGANLVSVSGATKNRFLYHRFRVNSGHWIGLHCHNCTNAAHMQWYGEDESYRNWVDNHNPIGPSETNVFTFIKQNGEWDYSVDINNERPYICERPDGCTNPDNPCHHGGTCNANTIGGYTCTCTSGYSGLNCTINDSCIGHDCAHGTCVHGDNTYTCECLGTGYRGQRCENDINECTEGGHNCAIAQGTCMNNDGGFSCLCDPGYTGSTCWDEIDECESNPCQNGGSCDDRVNAYVCECAPGFTGDTCQTDIDECQCESEVNECVNDLPCNSQGHCTNFDGGYNCTCFEDYNPDDNCASQLGSPGPTTEEENLTPYWTALYVAAVLCPLTFTLFMLLLVEDRIYHRRLNKLKRHNASVENSADPQRGTSGDKAARSDNNRSKDFLNLCEQDGSNSKVAALGDTTNEGACAL